MPLGIIYNHSISKRLYGGVELNYVKTIFDGNISIPTFDSKGTIVGSDKYAAHIDLLSLRAMLNIHYFYFVRKKWNAYVDASCGYYYLELNYTTDYPEYVKVPPPQLVPITAKIGTGFNYHFSKIFGAFAEGGIGGGYIVKGGFNIRF